MDGTSLFKKRNRVPASCSVCRKRKSKCDRVKPICGSCRKKSIAHLCYYEPSGRMSSPPPPPANESRTLLSIPPPPPPPPSMQLHQPNMYHNRPVLLQQPYSPSLSHGLQQQQQQQQQTQSQNQNQPPSIPIPTTRLMSDASTKYFSPLIQPPQPPSLPIPQLSQPSQPNINTLVIQDPIPSISAVSPTNSTVPVSKSQSESVVSPPVPTPSSTSSFTGSQRRSSDTAMLPQRTIPSLKPPDISPSSSHNGINESFSSYTLVSIPLGPNSSLQVSPEDRMNVFTNASFSMNLEGPIWQQHGTLSYIGLTKSDPFIKLFRNFTVILLKAGGMSKFLMNERKRRSVDSSSAPMGRSGSENDKKQESLDGALVAEDVLIVSKIVRNNVDEVKNGNSNQLDQSTPGSMKKKRRLDIMPALECLYSGEKKEYYRIVEKAIVEILPAKMNLFILFSRFFKYVHPFIPIIDEHVLLMDVNSPLDHFPEFTKDYHTQVNIKSDDDLRIMGILLLVMRLGYMSMIHNDSMYNNYNETEASIVEDMKQKVDSKTFVHVINLCISDALIATRSSFKLVQLLTLLYFYRQVAPDDSHGIGGADSHILFGVIMRHAMSIGLNRDPTFYSTHETICNNSALIKTWRFLWYYLVMTDATSAIHTGTNLNLMSVEVSDVQVPRYDNDKTGGLNQVIESLEGVCRSYRNIINKISNVSQKPKIVDILTETNHLEKLFFEIFGKDFFRDVICKPAKVPPTPNGFDIRSAEHEDTLVKVLKYCLFIQLRTNLSGMYYMVAIHYENVYNESKTPSMNAGIELFKIYIKSVVQLVYIMSYVLDNSVELFGKNYDFFLTSQNERYMIKTHSFLTSFFVRLLHQKKDLSFQVFKDPTIQPRLNVIDNLFTMVLVEAELFVGNFRKLSRTYINSYRLYIITYIILRQCIENPDVFFERTLNDHRFFHHGTNMIEFFTVGELNRLCKLCGEFKSAKESQEKLKLERRMQQQEMSTPGGINADISNMFYDDDNNDIFDNLPTEVKNEMFDPTISNDEFLRLFDICGDLAAIFE
ncbi:uncharacterized protein SPAPADRAFT_71571 [Spathaspora passalidarum NRRL Y-27907]|uniref:Zn(2)-C6 fungal-type domain-containing protein n=1 Tax=Spathaspora passalidarum (strain NRRL Y-27907 / 11-Y1) TaxID=619300 RepID=G3AP36_SPAPN|nr:uncharacterized protein SPAPADRAFT_71571 [Spathaspora passalidarum NRRL Y-27907]EGW32067.1 hypothetical protein SPAPADRAFT_71571 [Spathaspora passalidarum NRRL Y-27907]